MLANVEAAVKLPAPILPTKGRLVTRVSSRHSTDRYSLPEWGRKLPPITRSTFAATTIVRYLSPPGMVKTRYAAEKSVSLVFAWAYARVRRDCVELVSPEDLNQALTSLFKTFVNRPRIFAAVHSSN